MLWDMYKFASRFGVHGHVKLTEGVGVVQNIHGQNFVTVKSDPTFVRTCFNFNMVTMQAFMLAFLEEHGERLVDALGEPAAGDVRLLARDLGAIELTL
jgi:hypothetical protein